MRTEHSRNVSEQTVCLEAELCEASVGLSAVGMHLHTAPE